MQPVDVVAVMTGCLWVDIFGINLGYADKLAIYSGEIQQVFALPEHTTVVGARFQYGDFYTYDFENHPSDPSILTDPSASQDVVSLFRRISLYGYHQWQVADSLQLIGGLTYDKITFPEDIQDIPISSTDRTSDQLSPKAGLIWRPFENTVARFAFTRSMGGASLDQSFQLEPAQVAGFVQSFRSIIPEAIAGESPGARFQSLDLSLEQKLPSKTYLTLSGEILNSEINKLTGAYILYEDDVNLPYAAISNLREKLDYQEQTLRFTANQLIGQPWSLGLNYSLSQATLHENFMDVPDLPAIPTFNPVLQPRQKLEGTLQQLDLTAFYNDPRGPFAEAEAVWYGQSNQGFAPDEPGDHFWQLNAFVGYRSPRRRVEASVGVENIANQDYELNPLNIYNELPRKRTIAARFQLAF